MTTAKRLAGAAALGMAMLVGSGLCAPPAQAGYVVTLTQQGPNVVASGSGAIDLSGLTPDGTGGIGAGLIPRAGDIFTGPAAFITTSLDTGFTVPTTFGVGGGSLASSGSGDAVGRIFEEADLAVPLGYSSGSALSDTSIYNNQSFASLGVKPGTYQWVWGSGGPFRSFTLQIAAAAAAVPEPADILLLALPLGMLLAARYRMRGQRFCLPE
jgi:hypothetical protein